jgi:hypothetical protein
MASQLPVKDSELMTFLESHGRELHTTSTFAVDWKRLIETTLFRSSHTMNTRNLEIDYFIDRLAEYVLARRIFERKSTVPSS